MPSTTSTDSSSVTVELDDDVRRVAGRADEAIVAGLRVADDAGDVPGCPPSPAVVAAMAPWKLGRRSRRRRAYPSGRARSCCSCRTPNSSSRRAATVGRFGVRVEPATGAERARCLRRQHGRRDGQDDRDEGDGTAEAVDERSPAAEHRGGLIGRRIGRRRRTIENGHSVCQRREVAARERPAAYSVESNRSF